MMREKASRLVHQTIDTQTATAITAISNLTARGIRNSEAKFSGRLVQQGQKKACPLHWRGTLFLQQIQTLKRRSSHTGISASERKRNTDGNPSDTGSNSNLSGGT